MALERLRRWASKLGGGGRGKDNKTSPDVGAQAPEEREEEQDYEKLRPGEYRKCQFQDMYVDQPETEPIENQELHVSTDFAKVDGRNNYGGEGAKYNDENQDSVYTAVDQGGNMLVGVVDGAGSSEMLDPDTEKWVKTGRQISHSLSTTIAVEGARGNLSSRDILYLAHEQAVEKDLGNSYATAVAAKISKDLSVDISWAGDAKAMSIRGGKKLAEGITVLHNKAMELVDHDLITLADFYNHQENNVITSTIGKPGREPKIDSLQFQGEEGDMIVIASDGLWDIVSEYEVEKLSAEHRGDSRALQEALFDRVYARNNSQGPFDIELSPGQFVRKEWEYGDGDNISIQVVELKKPGEAGEGTPVAEQQPARSEVAAQQRTQELAARAERAKTEDEKKADFIKFWIESGERDAVFEFMHEETPVYIRRYSGEMQQATIDNIDSATGKIKCKFWYDKTQTKIASHTLEMSEFMNIQREMGFPSQANQENQQRHSQAEFQYMQESGGFQKILEWQQNRTDIKIPSGTKLPFVGHVEKIVGDDWMKVQLSYDGDDGQTRMLQELVDTRVLIGWQDEFSD